MKERDIERYIESDKIQIGRRERVLKCLNTLRH